MLCCFVGCLARCICPTFGKCMACKACRICSLNSRLQALAGATSGAIALLILSDVMPAVQMLSILPAAFNDVAVSSCTAVQCSYGHLSKHGPCVVYVLCALRCSHGNLPRRQVYVAEIHVAEVRSRGDAPVAPGPGPGLKVQASKASKCRLCHAMLRYYY